MKKSFHTKLSSYWRTLRPWLFALGILLILRVTGALSGLSVLANRALLGTPTIDTPPEATPRGKEDFDYNFTLNTLSGETVNFNKFKGKTIFLNLWATWCGPCKAEMPSIQSLYEKTNDQVVFVMLSLDRPGHLDRVKQYVSSNGFEFPVFVPSGELPKILQVDAIPTTFVISSDGTIAKRQAGMANYDSDHFRKFLEKL